MARRTPIKHALATSGPAAGRLIAARTARDMKLRGHDPQCVDFVQQSVSLTGKVLTRGGRTTEYFSQLPGASQRLPRPKYPGGEGVLHQTAVGVIVQSGKLTLRQRNQDSRMLRYEGIPERPVRVGGSQYRVDAELSTAEDFGSRRAGSVILTEVVVSHFDEVKLQAYSAAGLDYLEINLNDQVLPLLGVVFAIIDSCSQWDSRARATLMTYLANADEETLVNLRSWLENHFSNYGLAPTEYRFSADRGGGGSLRGED